MPYIINGEFIFIIQLVPSSLKFNRCNRPVG